MPNETKTIKFHLKESEKTFSIPFFDLEETFLEVRKTIGKYPDGCLLFRKHKFLQTQFILNQAKPFIMLVFDEKGKIVSAKSYAGDTSAPFSFFISDPFVFILPAGKISEYQNIRFLEIEGKHNLLRKNKQGIYEYLYDHDLKNGQDVSNENKRPPDQDRLTAFMKAINGEEPIDKNIWEWWKNRY